MDDMTHDCPLENGLAAPSSYGGDARSATDLAVNAMEGQRVDASNGSRDSPSNLPGDTGVPGRAPDGNTSFPPYD